MKITFPECQFDLTIEEYLILLDRETKGYTMTMKFPLPGEKAEVSAHVPAPVPYPSQEEPERIPEPPIFKFPPDDLEPATEQPQYEPGGIVNDQANAMPKSGEAMVKKKDLPPVPNKAKLKAKPKAKPKARPKRCKKVDVLFNGKWIAFDSVSAAAAQIGCKANSISNVLKKGGTVHGHEVRYHNEELDNVLAEIKANNRKPYETTPRP